jgi:succinate dehydrogenase / fumarate reductase cytochrome b subunit
MQRADRPVFLNLARIRFPVGAIASIGHRISGVLLVFGLPFAVLALERSLWDEAAFSSLLESIRSPLGRAAMVLIAWAGTHHLLAGVRHLLSDVGIGASLSVSRRSAYAVLVAGALLAVAAAFIA